MLPKFEIRDYSASVFIFIGAALRFYGFDAWSLSNDELSAIARTNFNSFFDLIDKGIWVDGHPALIQIFEYYWIKLFGNSVFAVRVPFVLMGIGSSIYFYRLCSTWLNKNAALLGLALFIPNYHFVLYSQVARPYVAGLFFVLAFGFYFFRFLQSGDTKKNVAGVIIFGTAASLTHYFSALSLFLIYLFSAIYLNKKNVKFYFLFALAIVVLYLPHIPITLNHLSIGGVSWLPKPDSDYLARYLDYFFQNSLLLQIIIVAVIATITIKKGMNFNWKAMLVSGFVFFSCFSIAYYYSIHKTPVLQFSVLIFASPFLFTFLFALVGERLNQKLIIALSSVFVLFGSYTLVAKKNIYTKKPFANFKAVSENSVNLVEKLGKKNVLSIANASNPFYLSYYTSNIDSNFQYNLQDIGGAISVAEVRNAINESKTEYILIAYANSVVPAEVHEYAKQKYSEIYFHERYFNSDIIVYSKSEKERKAYFDSHFLKDKNWAIDQNQLQDSIFCSDSISFHQTVDISYALTFKDTLKNLAIENNKYITVSAELRSNKAVDASLVFNVNRGDSSVYWRGTNVKPYFIENKWYKVIYVFEKPLDILPSDQVVIYFWNPNKEDYYIDEFKLYNFADSDYNYYEF